MNTAESISIPIPWSLNEEQTEKLTKTFEQTLDLIKKSELSTLGEMTLLLSTAHALICKMYKNDIPDKIVRDIVEDMGEFIKLYPDHAKKIYKDIILSL